MSRKKSPEDTIIRGLRSFADALESDEDLTTKFTCRKVALNLAPLHYTPEQVRKARETLGVSQSLFAQFLGTSLNSVKAWEQGDREPSPIACRFMDEIVHDPQAFRKRFIELATPAGSS